MPLSSTNGKQQRETNGNKLFKLSIEASMRYNKADDLDAKYLLFCTLVPFSAGVLCVSECERVPIQLAWIPFNGIITVHHRLVRGGKLLLFAAANAHLYRRRGKHTRPFRIRNYLRFVEKILSLSPLPIYRQSNTLLINNIIF